MLYHRVYLTVLYHRVYLGWAGGRVYLGWAGERVYIPGSIAQVGISRVYASPGPSVGAPRLPVMYTSSVVHPVLPAVYTQGCVFLHFSSLSGPPLGLNMRKREIPRGIPRGEEEGPRGCLKTVLSLEERKG